MWVHVQLTTNPDCTSLSRVTVFHLFSLFKIITERHTFTRDILTHATWCDSENDSTFIVMFSRNIILKALENSCLVPKNGLLHCSQTQQWCVALLTQCDDGQSLEREQRWATFVVYVPSPWQPPPYTDWRGESGDRCLTTPSRPRLRPLSHPQFVQVAIVTDPNTWKDE